MKTTVKVAAAVAILFFVLPMWAPWITDDYAINRVVESLEDQKLGSTIWAKTWL